MQKIFHTPEGVRDIYSRECAQKHQLTDRIRQVFQGYGYEELKRLPLNILKCSAGKWELFLHGNCINSLTEKAILWYCAQILPLLFPEPAPPISHRIRTQ